MLLDALDVRAPAVDAEGAPLRLELVEERLFDVGGQLHLAGGRHLRRIGVDGLGLGKVGDGRELLRRFEDDVAEPGLLRLHGGGDAADATADDGDVDDALAALALLEVVLARDRLHGARAGVRRELEQRHARQVADDAHAGDARGAVVVDLGQLLDGAGRPPGVQPANVAREHRTLPWGRHSIRLRRTLWIGFACASLLAPMLALMTELASARRRPRADGGAREKSGVRRHPDQRRHAALQGGEEAAARDRAAHRRRHQRARGRRQGGDRRARLRQHLRARRVARRARAADALALRHVADGQRVVIDYSLAERGQADAHRPSALDHHRRRDQARAALRSATRSSPTTTSAIGARSSASSSSPIANGSTTTAFAEDPVAELLRLYVKFQERESQAQGRRRAKAPSPLLAGGARRAGQAAAGRCGRIARCGRSSSTSR